MTKCIFVQIPYINYHSRKTLIFSRWAILFLRQNWKKSSQEHTSQFNTVILQQYISVMTFKHRLSFWVNVASVLILLKQLIPVDILYRSLRLANTETWLYDTDVGRTEVRNFVHFVFQYACNQWYGLIPMYTWKITINIQGCGGLDIWKKVFKSLANEVGRSKNYHSDLPSNFLNMMFLPINNCIVK